MFTSCYGRLRHVPDHLEPVAISRGVPRGWSGRRYLPLAPGKRCHRRMVAEWLKKTIGLDVPEWLPEGAPVAPAIKALTVCQP